MSDLEWVECVDCGEEFERDPSEWWKKRCYECWKTNKYGGPAPKPRQTPEEKKIEELNQQVETLEKAMIGKDQHYRRLMQEKVDVEKALAHYRGMGEFLEANIDFLVFASHPDRNPGRHEATEVAKVFLQMRRNIKGGTV